MAAIPQILANTLISDPPESQGRDEMNLAEFPIAALTDYLPKGQNTISFSDGSGSLMITGSDAYGLPTAADADVVVALILLTKRRNNFSNPSVPFTRTEILHILGWPESGKAYKRLTESLLRWSTTSLRYEGTWWDNRSRRKMNAVFHILNEVVLYDRAEPGGGGSLPLSYFTWNKIFLESCQAGNLKRLDVKTYFALEHASSKRLFRFLDKRLHRQADQTFDLAEIAFERVGLSRSYVGKKGGINIGKIREKLQPALDELEHRGFLVPMSREDRYSKHLDNWTIRFRRAGEAVEDPPPRATPEEPASLESPPAPVSPLFDQLLKRGVSRPKAETLVASQTPALIVEKLAIFDWKVAKNPRGMEKNPAGWLVKAIEDDYPAPRGFEPPSAAEARLQADRHREREGAEATRRKREASRQRDREEQAIDDHLSRLSPDQLAALEASALASAPEDTLLHLDSPAMARFRPTLLTKLLREHLASSLRPPTLF